MRSSLRSCSISCCCNYHASKRKNHHPLLFMMISTVHAVRMMHHHHHQTPPATAFLFESMHPLRMNRNLWGWRPISMSADAQQKHHTHGRRRRRQNLLVIAESATTTSDNIPPHPHNEQITTPYTINQSTCPTTHTTILEQLVTKHIHTLPQYWKNKPTASHNEEAFEYALEFVIRFGQRLHNTSSFLSSIVENEVLLGEDVSSSSSSSLSSLTSVSPSLLQTKVILDSGCGTGKSTHTLGERYPDCVVIGIDQSLARLNRNHAYRYDTNGKNNNVLLLRAEVTDFWKFCLASPEWHQNAIIIQHYLLYPNPYPKKSRLMNRFYAHPAFPLLMMTLSMNLDNNSGGGGGGDSYGGGGDIVINKNNKLDSENAILVVRSNWKGYLDEFLVASNVWINSGGDFRDWNDFLRKKDDDDEEWHPISKPGLWEIVGPKRLDGSALLSPMTNFEAKFLQCGEPVYELSIHKK